MGRLTVISLQALSLAAVGLIWEAMSRRGILDPLFIPAPSAIVGALSVVLPQALPRLGDTLLKTLGGYAVAVTLGVAGGFVLGSLPTLRRVTMPYTVALYSVPKILIVPWIVLVFGVSFNAAVLSGALFAVFPILLLSAGGIRDVEPILISVATSMGASRWQLYRKVLVPAALPSIFTGMRVGIVFALLGVLLAEMFAGTQGTGFLMKQLALGFNAPQLFAATALVSAFSISFVLLLDRLTEQFGKWRRSGGTV